MLPGSPSQVHPGGSIIDFYAGTDATEAWKEFHSRSLKAKEWLDKLPYTTHTPNREAMVQDFQELRAQLEKEGYFKPQPQHIAYRFAELILMHWVGFYLMTNGWTYLGIEFVSQFLSVSGLFIFSIANGRCGWLMHEGGHGSLTGNPTFDKTIQSVLFGLYVKFLS